VIWAADEGTRFVHHALAGGLTINAASGGAAIVNDPHSESEISSRKVGAIVHGALMLAAFGMMFPLGALAARHKWLGPVFLVRARLRSTFLPSACPPPFCLSGYATIAAAAAAHVWCTSVSFHSALLLLF
jgi:hypothetical protein